MAGAVKQQTLYEGISLYQYYTHYFTSSDIRKKQKMEKRVGLTSDVVNCDDAGGQHFSRGTKSPVPELLVGADA